LKIGRQKRYLNSLMRRKGGKKKKKKKTVPTFYRHVPVPVCPKGRKGKKEKKESLFDASFPGKKRKGETSSPRPPCLYRDKSEEVPEEERPGGKEREKGGKDHPFELFEPFGREKKKGKKGEK